MNSFALAVHAVRTKTLSEKREILRLRRLGHASFLVTSFKTGRLLWVGLCVSLRAEYNFSTEKCIFSLFSRRSDTFERYPSCDSVKNGQREEALFMG